MSKEQLFYSDICAANGYIPAAGVGMADKEFRTHLGSASLTVKDSS